MHVYVNEGVRVGRKGGVRKREIHYLNAWAIFETWFEIVLAT